MTKRELVHFLKLFTDDIEVWIEDGYGPKRRFKFVYDWPKPISKHVARIILSAEEE